LELGCGCGVISLTLASLYKVLCPKFFLSDLSAKAIGDARANFRANRIDADVRHGSVFDPWATIGQPFDIIINDISGISEEIARISPWFDESPFETGPEGIELLHEWLRGAGEFLNDSGVMVFPLINLCNVDLGLSYASKFFKLEKISETEWPIPSELSENPDFERACSRNNVKIRRRFGRAIGVTSVYTARKP